MIRKNFSLSNRQELLLRQLAKARGVSQSEIIRRALEREFQQGTRHRRKGDPEAWARARRVMLALQAQGPLPDGQREWKREDLYLR